jgi:hypothetical protein
MEWRLCAPAIAARGRARLWDPRARGFPQRGEVPLTKYLPLDPAAIYVYELDGTTRWLLGDFDIKKAMQRGALRPRAAYDQVAQDAADLAALIVACGGRSFADVSPSGGRHVYVPWAVPIAFEDMRRLGMALARRYPSFDHSPLLGRINGLLRPPGSRHPLGGYQRLTTAPRDVQRTLVMPNGGGVWERLLAALEPELEEVHRPGAPSLIQYWTDRTEPEGVSTGEAPEADRPLTRPDVAGMSWLPKQAGRRPALSQILESVARTGRYDTGCYASDSEARQAVITSAAASGWRLEDVVDQLHTGRWPGLSGLYARYGNDLTRAKALRSDWQNAVAYLSGERSGRVIHTCGNTHRGGASGCDVPQDNQWRSPVHSNVDLELGALQQIRQWWAAMEVEGRRRWGGETAITRRRILYAIVAAAQMAHSTVIDWGTRELGILAGGLDHSTVAKHLKEMRDEDDPVIDLLGTNRGKMGDLYALKVPQSATEMASWRRWPPGKLGGIHIVFSELGGSSAFVYEQLSSEGTRTVDLEHLTGLSRTTVNKALGTMAEHGLAERGGDGWRRGPIALDTVATRLGMEKRIPDLRARYRGERLLWWAFLEGNLRDSPNEADDGTEVMLIEPTAAERAAGEQVRRGQRKRRGVPDKTARRHLRRISRNAERAAETALSHEGPSWVDPQAELIAPRDSEDRLSPQDLTALGEVMGLDQSPALKRRYQRDRRSSSRDGARRPRHRQNDAIINTRNALRILSGILGRITILHDQDSRPP